MKGHGDIAVLMGAALVVMSAQPLVAATDQTRLPKMQRPAAADGGLGVALFDPSPGNEPLLLLSPGDDAGSGNTNGKGEDTPRELAPAISTVETVELTPDLAKRAIDGFIRLKENYQDTDIAEYETLEQFVAEATEGPALEKDVKSFGFKTVGEWNTAITSVSFAYAALSGTHEDEIRQELENIRNEVDLDEQMKKSLIDGLQSMLPSENNKKIVGDLNKQKDWAEKLKLLEESAEGADH
ncbi:MAG: hypothetical protein ACR2OL_08100 [Anderseniella sp.]